MAAESIFRLKVESKEYESKIDRARAGLLAMEQACRKVDGTLAIVEKDELEFARALGNMATVSNTAKGRINELTKAFQDVSTMYNRLTNEEKAAPFGQALSQSLDQLKGRIQASRTELEAINKSLNSTTGASGLQGALGNIDISGLTSLAGLGNPLGQVSSVMSALGTNIEAVTGLSLGMAAGVAAVGVAAEKATEKLIEYNEQLERENQRINVVTGLSTDTGSQGEDLRNEIDGMVKAYNVDFNQAVDTANTMMNKLGLTSQETIQTMRDGLQGMTEGDAPKFLQLMNQYAPVFRDMGLSAQQSAAVIHESLGGAFGEDGMSALIMAQKRIREMGTAAQSALQGIGIDAKQMQSDIQSGSMTLLQAIQQVATHINQVGYNSQEAGAAMSAVFGRQGANLGSAQLEAIANLNTNLDETKERTGAVGSVNAQLQQSYAGLNQQVSSFFGDTEDGLGTIKKRLEDDVVNALTGIMENLQEFKTLWDDVKSALLSGLDPIKSDLQTTVGIFGDILSIIGDLISNIYTFGNSGEQTFNAFTVAIKASQVPLIPLRTLLKGVKEILDWIAAGVKAAREKFDELKNSLSESFAGGFLKDIKGVLDSIVQGFKDVIKWYNDAKAALGVGGGSGSGSSAGGNGAAVGGLGGNGAPSSSKSVLGSVVGSAGGGGKSTGSHTGGSTKTYSNGLNIQKESGAAMTDLKGQGLEGTTESMNSLKAELQRWTKAMGEATTTEAANYIQQMIDQCQRKIDAQPLALKLGVSTEAAEHIQDQFTKMADDMRSNMQPVEIDESGFKNINKVGKDTAKAWSTAASSIQSVSGAIGQIDDKGVQLGAAIATSIANIMMAYAEAMAKDQSSKNNIWAFIAAAAASTISMAVTIAQFKKASNGYAEGGIVKGSTYTGDAIPAMLNAQEVVLSAAQTERVASSIQGGAQSYATSMPYVTGDKLVLGINNWAGQHGKGQLVFSKS